jgi:hypothetical protein
MDPLTKEDGIINDIGRVMATKRTSENGALRLSPRDTASQHPNPKYLLHAALSVKNTVQQMTQTADAF